MSPREPSVSSRFTQAIRQAASADLGRPILAGTSVVGAAAREGSTNTVAYPMGESTLILCAPDIAPRLAHLNGDVALSNEAFVEAATALGGIAAGWGRFRVHEGRPPEPDLDATRVRPLDRANAADRELIENFVAGCSEADLDETELELDDLDPDLLGIQDETGALVALAMGRPWDLDANFDDVGVITHPEHRSQGLGGAAVALFVRQLHSRGRFALYNCDVVNVGSDRLADALGFTVAQTVASVRLE